MGGVPNYGIADNFPILWQMAQEYDFAERLGGCNSNLHAEVDRALRELWDARRAAAPPAAPVREGGEA